MGETEFSREFVKRLKKLFPGCIVLRNNPNYKQGVPDIIVLYEDRWATLEAKKHANASTQPNQPYYVDLMNEMSYSSFVYPENEEDVIADLMVHFR